MNTYIDIFSGSEVSVLQLKDRLEQEGIPSIVQNDMHSGNLGGFFGGTPSTVRLKIRQSDLERSRSILEELNNQS